MTMVMMMTIDKTAVEPIEKHGKSQSSKPHGIEEGISTTVQAPRPACTRNRVMVKDETLAKAREVLDEWSG